MIKSMTGYGKAVSVLNGREITVEIKSVNHRFFEFSARFPRAYGFLEEKLKAYVQKKVSRGKVEVAVSINNIDTSDYKISVNEALAKEYVDALRSLCEPLKVADDIKLSTITRFQDVFTVTKDEADENALWEDARSVLDCAVDSFVSMRETEGENLKADILSRLVFIENAVSQVEKRSEERNKEYRQRLYLKLKELVESTNIDDSRILTEAAIFADKTAVDEETIRLRSHISQVREFLEYEEPVGRKLDFIIQEFNREANTIGSKCQDTEGAKLVVDIKAEIEKIREQVQNIE